MLTAEIPGDSEFQIVQKGFRLHDAKREFALRLPFSMNYEIASHSSLGSSLRISALFCHELEPCNPLIIFGI